LHLPRLTLECRAFPDVVLATAKLIKIVVVRRHLFCGQRAIEGERVVTRYLQFLQRLGTLLDLALGLLTAPTTRQHTSHAKAREAHGAEDLPAVPIQRLWGNLVLRNIP